MAELSENILDLDQVMVEFSEIILVPYQHHGQIFHVMVKEGGAIRHL